MTPYTWTVKEWAEMCERAVHEDLAWADEHGTAQGILTTTEGWMEWATADACDTLTSMALDGMTKEELVQIVQGMMVSLAVGFNLGRQFQKEHSEA